MYAINPMDIYYQSIGAIKWYEHENGCVTLTGTDGVYAVNIVKQTSSFSERHISRGRLDVLAADEFYNIACRYLRDEIEWREPVRKFSCKYNPNRSRGCTPQNCPRCLGGAAYWEIFAKSCPHRTNGRQR